MNQAETRRRQAEALSNIWMLITILVIGRMTGNNGITYVAVAVEIYAMLWTALSGNLSDVLGKLLRSRKNKRQYRNILNMRRNAMIFQAVLGLFGCLLLLISAEKLAGGLFKIPYSEFIIRILSPVVLLRSASEVLSGYFLGEGSEFPRAAAGILRQILILGLSILFSGIFGSHGEKVSELLREENFTAMYGGMGVAFAISLTEVLILLFLAAVYLGSHRSERSIKPEGMYSSESFFDCIMYIYTNRWPLILTGILKILPLTAGLLLFSRAMEEESAMTLEYGAYAGGYLVVCGIAVALIYMVTLPMITRTFASLRREENRFAKTVFQSGVHICLIHGIFASIFVAVLGGRIAGLLCPENGDIAMKMLQGGSSVILFTALAFYFGRFLQAAGKRYLVLGSVSIADLIFIISVLVFLGTGKAGALSLVYGGMMGVFVLCIMLGVLCYRQMRLRVDWLGILIVPLGAGGVTGLICLLLGSVFPSQVNDLIVLIIAFVTAVAVYWVILLLLRNIKEQELEVISGGRLISALGQMLRVY